MSYKVKEEKLTMSFLVSATNAASYTVERIGDKVVRLDIGRDLNAGEQKLLEDRIGKPLEKE